MKYTLALIFLIPLFAFSQNYDELQTLEPETFDQKTDALSFGKSMDVYGTIAVVGAPGNNEGIVNGGAIYIYELVGGNWTLINSIIGTNAETNFGASVAISDEFIIVGAPGNDSDINPIDPMVLIYEKPVAGWSEEPNFTALFDPEFDDAFGLAVAIEENEFSVLGLKEDTYHIGVYEIDNTTELSVSTLNRLSTDGITNPTFFDLDMSSEIILAGFTDYSRALVYAKDGTWTNPPIYAEITDNTGYGFGQSVSSINNTIAVSNSFEFNNVDDDGLVYIFENTEDDWTKLVNTNTIYPDLTDETTFSSFGMSLDLVQDSILVVLGNYIDLGLNDFVTAAFTFNNSFGGSWSDAPVRSRQTLKEAFADAGVLKGSNSALCFAQYNTTSGNYANSGSASLLEVDGEYPNFNTAVDIDGLSVTNTINSAQQSGFGKVLAASAEYMAIGSPLANTQDFINTGKIDLYRFDNGSWTYLQSLDAPEPGTDTKFGGALTIDGSILAVGIPKLKKVLIYDLTQLNNGSQGKIATLTPSTAADASSTFGASLDLEGEYLFIGNERKQKFFATKGAVYFYKKIGANWVDATETNLIETPEDQDFTLFGNKVIYNNGFLFVGQPYFNSSSNTNSGKINIYKAHEDGWENGAVLLYELSSAQPIDNALFGHSFDVQNNLLSVWQSNKVFVYQGQSNWTGVTELYSTAKEYVSVSDFEQNNIKVYKNSVLIGEGNAGTDKSGEVTILSPSTTNGWNAPTSSTLVDSAPAKNDYFGASMATAEDHLVITKALSSNVSYQSGASVVFGNFPRVTLSETIADTDTQKAFLVTFDQDIVDFSIEDISIAGGSVISFEWVDELTVRVIVNPENSNSLNIVFPENKVTNTTGYPNKESNALEIVVTSIEALLSQQTVAYPNPVSDQLTLAFDWAKGGESKIHLYSSVGKRLRSYTTSNTQLELPFDKLKKGIYIIKVEGNRGAASIRVIKQ